MKALLYTSDPYEPSGVIGIYETEEQKQEIIKGYEEDFRKAYPEFSEEYVKQEIEELREIEIPIGVYGQYY